LGEFGIILPANTPGTCNAFNQRECTAWTDIIVG
jgi:hypothetical protein